MSKFADKVQQDLIRTTDQDELVLPALSGMTLQIREAAEDPDVSTRALSKVIGNDAALTMCIIHVVNSPLLHSPKEIAGLQMAISWLGINYTCNLATGPTMEQMFQVTTDVVDHKTHEVRNKSTEIAGTCHVLVRHYTRLAPDQVALVGLIHQIGVLPILTYAGDRNELLSDPISPSHIVEHIHSLIGERILKARDFSAPITEIPRQHLDFTRNLPRVNYTDLVQVATLQSYLGSEYPYTRLGWNQILAPAKLSLKPAVDMKEDKNLPSVLKAATSVLQQARPIPPGSAPAPAGRPARPD